MEKAAKISPFFEALRLDLDFFHQILDLNAVVDVLVRDNELSSRGLAYQYITRVPGTSKPEQRRRVVMHFLGARNFASFNTFLRALREVHGSKHPLVLARVETRKWQ